MRPSGEASGRAWQAVRRALGRLVAQAAVRGVPPSEMTPTVAVRAPRLRPAVPRHAGRAGAGLAAGRRDPAVARPPGAEAGARDGDLLPAVRLAEGGGARAARLPRDAGRPEPERSRVESADLLLPAFVVRLPDSFLALPPAPVRVRPAGLLTLGAAALAGRTLNGWGVADAEGRALRLPRVPAPRVRLGRRRGPEPDGPDAARPGAAARCPVRAGVRVGRAAAGRGRAPAARRRDAAGRLPRRPDPRRQPHRRGRRGPPRCACGSSRTSCAGGTGRA